MSSTLTFVPAFAILCAIQAGLAPSINDLTQTLSLAGLSMTKAISPTSNVPDNTESGESGAADRSSGSFPLPGDPFASDNDLTGERTTPRLNMSHFFAASFQLWQVVAGLVVHVSIMARAIVQIQDKVSKIENGQQQQEQQERSSEGDEGPEATSMQIKDMWNAMTEQQDHISKLTQELAQQRQEIDQYRKNFEELTAKFDDDGKQFNQFMTGLKSALVDQVNDQTRHAQELAAVKKEMTRKFTVFNAELTGVRTDLSLVKSFPVPNDSAGQTAKEARRARILASVAQRMEEKELAQEIEILCPLPGARSSACDKATTPVASSSTTPAQAPIAVAESSASVKERETRKADSTETVEPGASQSASVVPQIKESKGKEPEGKGKEPEGKVPQSKGPEAGSPKVAQPGAGSSAQTPGLPQPRKSLLPGPRKSMLPAPSKSGLPTPRKSALPTPLSRSNAGNVAKAAKPVDRAQAESVTQTAPTATVTVRRVPLEPTGPGVRNEIAAPLPASSSLAALDAAAKELPCDLIITLTSPDDSMSFLDLDASFTAVPPFPNVTSNDDDDEDPYFLESRKRATVKPSRRL